MQGGTYSDDKLGEVLVLQLGVVEQFLRDSRDERKKLKLVQLFVGRHIAIRMKTSHR